MIIDNSEYRTMVKNDNVIFRTLHIQDVIKTVYNDTNINILRQTG